ncbi:MAG: hypothetical protein JJU00_03810 [Opitutales bacterium]|nr:hypothetical protein [Opitutales bacterium]
MTQKRTLGQLASLLFRACDDLRGNIGCFVFNRIVGEATGGGFELAFADFLDTAAQADSPTPTRCQFIYVDQEGFEQHPPKTFASLVTTFTEYQP